MSKQISVVMKNQPGILIQATHALQYADIDIRAMSVAESADYSVVRMVVNDHDRGVQALKEVGLVVTEQDIIIADVDDKPGGLNPILEAFKKSSQNIQYLYPFISNQSEKIGMVIRTEDVSKSKEILEKQNISFLT